MNDQDIKPNQSENDTKHPDKFYDYSFFTPSEYRNMFGTSIIESENIIKNLREQHKIFCIHSISEVNKIKINYPPIIINSQNINSLVNGGFQINKIYLLYGEFSTGKSQFCHDICMAFYKLYSNRQNPFHLFFIDSENSFQPEKLQQMAKSNYYSMNFQELIKKIKLVKISNLSIFQNYLQHLSSNLSKDSVNLLLIDSITAFIRNESDIKNYSINELNKKLKKCMEKILNLKNLYNIFIIMTSQVKSTPSIKLSGKFSIKPLFSYTLNEYCDELIYLYKQNEIRYAYLINSLDSKEKQVCFRISDEGILD